MYIHNTGVFNEVPGGWVCIVQQLILNRSVRHLEGMAMTTVNSLMQAGFTYKQAYRLWKSIQPAVVQDKLNEEARMDRAEALAVLHDINAANEAAAQAITEARVLSGAAQGKVDEAAWVKGIKEQAPTYDGGFFVMNTDRIIR